jgi:hypothetical protein
MWTRPEYLLGQAGPKKKFGYFWSENTVHDCSMGDLGLRFFGRTRARPSTVRFIRCFYSWKTNKRILEDEILF